MEQPIRLCFVCLGNICRSPTAEGVMRSLVRGAKLDDRITVESAGVGAYHLGEPPDRRAREAAKARGVTLNSRAQQFTAEDFDRFDYVVAMDRKNREDLLDLAPDARAEKKIHLLRSFDAKASIDAEVPDPYLVGGPKGFKHVFDICEAACAGLLAKLRDERGLA